MSSSPPSMTRRLLPWLVPVAMVFIGLVFVASSLSGNDEPTSVEVAPTNVQSVVADNAQAWASGQVGPQITTEISSVLIVNAAATGSSTYSARAVVVRLDSRVILASDPGATLPTLAEADKSTVATCVLWDVDVSARTVLPQAATEVTREIGHHEVGDTEALRERCEALQFPG